MNSAILEKLSHLELVRLERDGFDLFTSAWDSARVACEIERAAHPNPSAADVAAVWQCLKTAEACEEWLREEGRSTACDTGETAADRVRGYLNSLAGQSLRSAEGAI